MQYNGLTNSDTIGDFILSQMKELASLVLREYPVNVWQQSETKHNELLHVNGGACLARNAQMLRYATCHRFCIARIVLQECTLKVQEGKFKLQDLLVVPMQRVLKYHLLLKARAISTLQLSSRRYSNRKTGLLFPGNKVDNTTFMQEEDKVICRVAGFSSHTVIIALH